MTRRLVSLGVVTILLVAACSTRPEGEGVGERSRLGSSEEKAGGKQKSDKGRAKKKGGNKKGKSGPTAGAGDNGVVAGENSEFPEEVNVPGADEAKQYPQGFAELNEPEPDGEKKGITPSYAELMGVSIEGTGTPTIRVEGCARFGAVTHKLQGDYIEAGSWGVVAAITNGEIEVTGARAEDMEVIAAPLRQMGLRCTYEGERFTVEPSPLVATRRITTGLWPGFPSDMVSLVTVLATQADGRTLVHDWLYELRLFALEQLSAMRADLFLCDPHRIIVSGPKKLRGRLLDARDLRSGMALIAAALAAEGESTVTPLETVERGYASLVERLRSLGAMVEREA